MEAATSAERRTPAPRRAIEVARRWIDRYGLIAVLLVLPVVYGIQDLQDEGDLSRLASNLKDGLSNGAIWALIALGYTLVYGIIQLINFAHGDLFMIGSFVAVGLYGTVGLTTGKPRHRAGRGPAGRPRRHDGRLRRPQRDDRARGVPTIAQRPEARSPDHGRRLLLHPPERRHPLARRLPAGVPPT